MTGWSICTRKPDFDSIRSIGLTLTQRLNDLADRQGLCKIALSQEWQDKFRQLAVLDNTYDSRLRKENPEEFVLRTLVYQKRAYEEVRRRYE